MQNCSSNTSSSIFLPQADAQDNDIVGKGSNIEPMPELTKAMVRQKPIVCGETRQKGRKKGKMLPDVVCRALEAEDTD